MQNLVCRTCRRDENAAGPLNADYQCQECLRRSAMASIGWGVFGLVTAATLLYVVFFVL